jgi:lipase ATG15
MTGNAYGLPGGKRWYDLDPAWNTVRSVSIMPFAPSQSFPAQSFPFGWEDAADGFRGHVFLSSDNSTVILSIKGTTLNGPSTKKDKFNGAPLVHSTDTKAYVEIQTTSCSLAVARVSTSVGR